MDPPTPHESPGPSSFLGTFLRHTGQGNELKLIEPESTSMAQSRTDRREQREVVIPQRTYVSHYQFVTEDPITFPSCSGRDGITFTDIMNEDFSRLVGRDDSVFADYLYTSISLRFEVTPALVFLEETLLIGSIFSGQAISPGADRSWSKTGSENLSR